MEKNKISQEHLVELQLLAEKFKSATLTAQLAHRDMQAAGDMVARHYGFEGGRLDMATGEYTPKVVEAPAA